MQDFRLFQLLQLEGVLLEVHPHFGVFLHFYIPGGSNEAFRELFGAYEECLDDVSKRHSLNALDKSNSEVIRLRWFEVASRQWVRRLRRAGLETLENLLGWLHRDPEADVEGVSFTWFGQRTSSRFQRLFSNRSRY